MFGPEPLWEDSSTFASREVAEYKAKAQRLNQCIFELSKGTGNGGTKSPFKVSVILSFVLIFESLTLYP